MRVLQVTQAHIRKKEIRFLNNQNNIFYWFEKQFYTLKFYSALNNYKKMLFVLNVMLQFCLKPFNLTARSAGMVCDWR